MEDQGEKNVIVPTSTQVTDSGIEQQSTVGSEAEATNCTSGNHDNDAAVSVDGDKAQFAGRTDFTSEIFKIEITNLPNKFGFSQLKKRLVSSMGLRPHKIKALPNKPFAFVCFSCEADRETALRTINGHVWKGRELRAKEAKPVADPLKRKLENKDGAVDEAKRKKMEELDSLSPAVRIKASVTPLWETPYEEQLKLKTETVREVLKDVSWHPDVRNSLHSARKQHGGALCCALLPAMPSPVMESYRNKSEFSIGRSEDGNETVVGFRFGLYKEGTDCVGSPSEITIIPSAAKAVVQSFQNYVRSSQHEPYDHRNHTGHWRQLTVRTSQGGGVIAVAEFVMQDTTEEDREKEKESLKKYFTEGEGQSSGVTSLFFRPCTRKSSNSTSEEPYELLFGDGYVYETLMGMKFRISPSAFFQVNTAAAEVLYKLIADWAQASPNTTVLDICCGTGTIGLSMAKRVSRVIGIEMCKEAIEDAKVNTQLNGVTNCTYRCAKVQDVIQDIVHGLGTDDVVAILDPPRAGIHNSVIKALRGCRQLKRIVYASCHPQIAKTNFLDMMRPESRKTRGQPFQLVKAIPVDMFPLTKHCELLVLFERGQEQKTSPGNAASENTPITEEKMEAASSAETEVPSIKDIIKETSADATEKMTAETSVSDDASVKEDKMEDSSSAINEVSTAKEERTNEVSAEVAEDEEGTKTHQQQS